MVRILLLCFLILGGCAEEKSFDPEEFGRIETEQLVRNAIEDCKIETADAPDSIPGKYEVCLAEKANSVPEPARSLICSQASVWAGFIEDGICHIDAE